MVSLSSLGPPLLTAVLAGLWLTAASAAAHRLVGSAGSALDRVLATGLAAGFLGIMTVIGVGTAGLLDRPAVSYVAWAAVAALTCGAARTSPPAALRALAVAGRETLDLVFAARSRSWVFPAAVAVPAVLLLHERVVMPPTAWDALTYHLTFPLHWLQSGGLTTLPLGAGDPSPEYYPLNVEMLFYYGFAVTGSDWWAAFAQVPPLLGGAAAVAGTALRCGADREDASMAAILWMSVPLVLRLTFQPMVDLFLAAFLLSALYFLLRILETPAAEPPARGMLLAAALGAGLAAGTKYTGPFVAAAVLAPAAIPAVRRLFRARATGRTVAALAGAVLVAALAGGYVYARNFWIGANPFLPMEVVFGGSVIFPGHIDSDAYFRAPQSRLTPASLFASARSLLDFGPAFVALLAVPLIALARSGRRADPGRLPVGATAAAFALGMFVFFVVIPYRENRHLVVPLAMASALLGVLPAAVRRAAPWVVLANVPFALYYWGKDLVVGGGRPFQALTILGLALVVVGISRRPGADLCGRAARAIRGMPRLAWPLLAGAVWVALAHAHEGYHRHRYDEWLRYWSARYESGAEFVHRRDLEETAQAWRHVAEMTRDAPATVAYVGNNLPYPLTGYDLGNRVLFVPRSRDEAFTGFDRRHLGPEGEASMDAWLEHVRALGVEYLVVFRHHREDDPTESLPLEAEWSDENPQMFEMIYENDFARIYRTGRAAASG